MTLEIITAEPLIPLRHGFFTRRGGASSGVFSGLNCGYGSSDQTEAVSINRTRVAEAMKLPPADLATVRQIHSTDVVTISGLIDGPTPRADAMVSATTGVALAILTADCQPVLFADTGAGVIGAAHAGWKGALGGILENTLDAMENLGADRGNIAAVIGPSISQAAYEVGPEFLDEFITQDDENSRFFASGKGNKYQFDLPAYGLHRLRQAGVGHAEWTRHCTYADAARFYSYRRSVHLKEADYGRMVSTIRL